MCNGARGVRNAVLIELTMVVMLAHKELQSQHDKEVHNIQTSEGLVSHAVDEKDVPEKNMVLSL